MGRGEGIAMRQLLEYKLVVHFGNNSAPVVAVYGGCFVAEHDGRFDVTW